jgi:RNA polymerase sigma factor (TIGR02999 family)
MSADRSPRSTANSQFARSKMSDITRTIDAAAAGDRQAAADLLPLVYDELRKLAAARMAAELPDHTLQPTALVHEAYLRLVGPADVSRWSNRGHFFAAAAEAMRRILVESARRKQTEKRGGRPHRSALDPDQMSRATANPDQWIDLDEALAEFEKIDATAAGLAKLRVFGGLSVEQAGETLGTSRATAFRLWTYAQAWLTAALADRPADQSANS